MFDEKEWEEIKKYAKGYRCVGGVDEENENCAECEAEGICLNISNRAGEVTIYLLELKEQRDELLEACKVILEWGDREEDHTVDFGKRVELCEQAFNMARAAITKAEGSQS